MEYQALELDPLKWGNWESQARAEITLSLCRINKNEPITSYKVTHVNNPSKTIEVQCVLNIHSYLKVSSSYSASPQTPVP